MQTDDPKIAPLLEERAKLEKQLAKYEDIVKDMEAIDRILRRYGYNPSKSSLANGQPSATVSSKEIPTEYSRTLTWEDRVLYALSLIGEGFVDDVAKKLNEVDSDIDIGSARKRSTLYLSKMYRDGIIKLVSRDGRKFKYGIKE